MNTFLLIIKILPWVLSLIGIGNGVFAKFRLKKKSEKIEKLEKENKETHENLTEEIKRSNEIKKQVNDLLEFQSNDSEIESKMNEHVKILKKAGSDDSIKTALKEISSDIRSIYNNN